MRLARRPELFEATASLAGYFPKPTAVDPIATLAARVRGVRYRMDSGPLDLEPACERIGPSVTQFGPIENEKALNLDGTEGLRRAPRPMKMGTTALPWRYDAAARRCDPAG